MLCFQLEPGHVLFSLMSLRRYFMEAGFDWREPGCSMCLAMNPDKLMPQERCASTSNRNFEGRQGNGGRTHLCSPAMAAAAAVTGTLTDVRELGTGAGLTGEDVPSTDSKSFLDGRTQRLLYHPRVV